MARFMVACLLACACAASSTAARAEDGIARRGEVLVKLAPGSWIRVECDPAVHPLRAARAWSRVPGVAGAQPNYLYRPHRAPSDPRYADQAVHRITRAEGAWDVTTGDPAVVVAVIGAGVEYGHPELEANMWRNPGEIGGNGLDDDGNGFVDDLHGWDFVDDDGDPFDPDEDHDTRVAGVLGAEANNDIGGAGIVWHTSIMPLRVDYSSAHVTQAIDYAVDNGAAVLVLSFGIYLPQVYGRDTMVGEALARAEQAGVVAVASAGNHATLTPSYPAASPDVLAVASTTDEDLRAGFSNAGGWVDVCAPGQGLVTTGGAGTITEADGTSFSCPYVAGVAAMIRAVRPGWTAGEIRRALMFSGVRLDDERFLGHGRLDARAALLFETEPAPFASIRYPERGAVLTTLSFPVIGAALGDGFALAFRPAGTGPWIPLATGNGDREDEELGALSLATLEAGAYELRLEVEAGGATDTCLVPFWRGHDQLAGWPAGTFGPVRSSATFGDLDGDGAPEILVADTNHFVHGWSLDAAPLWDAPLWTVEQFPHLPALGDLDGDGDVEIVATAHSPGGEEGAVYAWHHDGSPVAGWPQTLGPVPGAPVLADLDADGVPGIVVAEDGEEVCRVFAFGPGGDVQPGWPAEIAGHARSSPATADLDGDGRVDVLVSTSTHDYLLRSDGTVADGWPRDAGGDAPATCCAAAAFGPGGGAQVVVARHDRIELVEADGTLRPGWPRELSCSAPPRLALGDLTGDSLPEVVVTCGAWIHVFAADGMDAAGWPLELDAEAQAAPAIADLDGDGAADVCLPAADGQVHAFKGDGTRAEGFPLRLDGASVSSPAVGDLDEDGQLDLLVGGSRLRWRLWAFSHVARFHPGALAWSRARHDPHNTAYHPRRFTLTATRPQPDQAHLAWQTPADIAPPAAYAVYRDHEVVARTTDRESLDRPRYGGDYTYLVAALDRTGCIRARSEPVTLAIEGDPPPDAGLDGGDMDEIDMQGGCGCGHHPATWPVWLLVLAWARLRRYRAHLREGTGF